MLQYNFKEEKFECEDIHGKMQGMTEEHFSAARQAHDQLDKIFGEWKYIKIPEFENSRIREFQNSRNSKILKREKSNGLLRPISMVLFRNLNINSIKQFTGITMKKINQLTKKAKRQAWYYGNKAFFFASSIMFLTPIALHFYYRATGIIL